MNRKQIGLLFVLADFTAFTAYVLYHYGYVGLFQAAMANAATLQVLIDLVLALTFFLFWMRNDARERGINMLPYALMTLTLGSIGALVYLIRRESAPATARSAMTVQAARA